MENLKEMIKKLFTLAPYSKERYKLSKDIQELENNLGLRTNYYDINEKDKTIKCELLKKVNGLYETLETFKIENIRIYERKF